MNANRNFLKIQPGCAIILKYGKTNSMKNKSRLAAYILLNIVISAATILLVMWLWDRTHPQPTGLLNLGNTQPPPDEQSQTLTADNAEDEIPTEYTLDFVTDDYAISILTIVGPGNLDLEHVTIQNESQGAVDMTGWQIIDENEHAFTFPTFILNMDGSVKIFSQKGTDTVIELYWQSDDPIWQSGETARLQDRDGNTVATYSIP
jgi:hypothetical protein